MRIEFRGEGAARKQRQHARECAPSGEERLHARHCDCGGDPNALQLTGGLAKDGGAGTATQQHNTARIRQEHASVQRLASSSSRPHRHHCSRSIASVAVGEGELNSWLRAAAAAMLSVGMQAGRTSGPASAAAAASGVQQRSCSWVGMRQGSVECHSERETVRACV